MWLYIISGVAAWVGLCAVSAVMLDRLDPFDIGD